MSENLDQIYHDCLKHLNELRGQQFVVPKSIPIPFFGDVNDYLNSRLRIVTAALNPSDQEFPAKNMGGYSRFDVSNGLLGTEQLAVELSSYFKKNPYRRWFSSFEMVLKGMGASYGGKMSTDPFKNSSIHVDLCSPIATSPTWSGLLATDRNLLVPFGRSTFIALMKELKPHIIIASVGWGHLDDWMPEFKTGRQWRCLKVYDQAAGGGQMRAPLRVQAEKISFPDCPSTIFVNATAANIPLGRFSNERKKEVGSILLDHLNFVDQLS